MLIVGVLVRGAEELPAEFLQEFRTRLERLQRIGLTVSSVVVECGYLWTHFENGITCGTSITRLPDGRVQLGRTFFTRAAQA